LLFFPNMSKTNQDMALALYNSVSSLQHSPELMVVSEGYWPSARARWENIWLSGSPLSIVAHCHWKSLIYNMTSCGFSSELFVSLIFCRKNGKIDHLHNQIKSEYDTWLVTFCCILGQDTLPSQVQEWAAGNLIDGG